MQKKFKDSGISFDRHTDSWKSKSVANFGGTFNQPKSNIAPEKNPIKKTLFENLAGSSIGENNQKRTRILTELE